MSKRKRDHHPSSASSSQHDIRSQPESKRNREALLSYALAAIKEDIKQEIASVVAKTIREVIKEELQQLMNSRPSRPLERAPSTSIGIGDGKKLELHFTTRLSPYRLYAGKHIEGEDGAPICVALIDANTGNVVESGREASIKLDVVVLDGEFNEKNNNDWTQEDFEKCRLREREGKAPLLVGDLHVKLDRGVGVLGGLKFTDNSSWTRKGYKIGVKLASGYCEGVRIREATLDAVRIWDQRCGNNPKHHPAKPDDEVCRLKKIAKDGPYHRKLVESGISRVEDLLREYFRDAKSLREILGRGMTDKKWEVLIEHAKSSVQSGKLYLYCNDNVASRHGVIFDILRELKGFVVDGFFCSVDSLSPEQKEQYDNMVTMAYHDWDNVKEYDSPTYYLRNSACGTSAVGLNRRQEIYSNNPSDCRLTDFHVPASYGYPPGSSGMEFEEFNGTAADESPRNVPNNEDVVWDQPMHSTDQMEILVYHNSGLPDTRSAALAFEGCSASDLPCHKDPSSHEEWPSINLRDGHGIEDRTVDSDNERWIESLLNDIGSSQLPSRRVGSKSAVVSWLRIKAVFKWGFFVRRIVTNKVRPTIEQLN